MRRKFIETANYKLFLARWAMLGRRGAGEACLMVVEGVPGVGKTAMLSHWATQRGALFVRATAGMRPNALLRAILFACCGAQSAAAAAAPRHYEALKQEVIRRMGDYAQSFIARGDELALVIDEADHIAGMDTLEALRDISDTLEAPIILVGMGQLQDRIKRSPPIASRVGQWVNLARPDVDTATKDFKALCGCLVADDLAAWVAQASGGCMREMMEAAAAVERAAARLKPDEAVALAALAGQALMPDRKHGGMICAPAAKRGAA